MKICIGGTFNIFHKGHKILLNTAIEKAGIDGYLFIGVTSNNMIKSKKYALNFEDRKKNITKYLSNIEINCKIEIKKINDKYGPSITEDFDGIVVSPETRNTAEEINNRRRKINKKPLLIFEIPFVLADDIKPISSTRIFKSEIDEKGKIL